MPFGFFQGWPYLGPANTQYLPLLKFIYSEKAAKFCEIFPLLLTTVHTVKSKGKISQNFVTFSEYMNFTFQDNLRVIFDQWPKLPLGLDALSNQRISHGVQ